MLAMKATTMAAAVAQADESHGVRAGAAVYSRDGAWVGTIAEVFRAASAEPTAPDRYAFLLEPGPTPVATGPRGPVCLPASSIVRAARGRVTLSLTRQQLAA
jgi:hypothetical protein